MIDLDNHTVIDIDVSIFEPILESLSSKDLELIIVDDREIKQINQLTRSVDKATDVLSFPLHNMPQVDLLGTIVISIDHVSTAATKFGHTKEEELKLLFIHGLLHLLGMDHESDQGEMRMKEHALIEQFSLPQSLIIRTEKT